MARLGFAIEDVGMRLRATWRLGGVLVGLGVLIAAPAGGEERLRARAIELALASGYSVSGHFGPDRNVATRAFHLIPHVGFVLTDERGPGWLRGNFELLLEPTLIHVTEGGDSTVGGISFLGRWLFAGSGRVRPYLEAGLGAVGGDLDLPRTRCDVNFIVQGGPGLLIFLSERAALTLGYRFHHVSNSNVCDQNVGLNSSLFIAGVSYFFP